MDIEEALFFLIQKSESVEFRRPRTSKQKPVKQRRQGYQGRRETPYVIKDPSVDKDAKSTEPEGGSPRKTISDAEVQKMVHLVHLNRR